MSYKPSRGGAKVKGTRQFGAIEPHQTPTDDGPPDPNAATKLDPTEDNLKGMHAFQDPKGDPTDPASFKFPHHNVGDDGKPGAANIPAVKDAKVAAAADDSLSAEDQAGVQQHLDAHLADASANTDDAGDDNDPPQSNGLPNDKNAPSPFSVKTDAAPDVSVDDDRSFTMPIMVIEGSWTGDWRYIAPQSLTWRDLPLPVMVLTSTTPTHDGAQLVGQLTSIERFEFEPGTIDSRTGQPYKPGAAYLTGYGKFDTSDTSTETARLVREGFLRGVSVDIGDAISEMAMVDANGDDVEQDDDDWDLFDLLFGFNADGAEVDEENPEADVEDEDSPVYFGERIVSGRLMGATICPFPAFEGAYVVIGDTSMAASAFNPTESGPGVVYRETTARTNSLVAAGGPIKPPAKWFSTPNLTAPTAISIDESGRVFGHLASWTECHIGYQSSCMTAPKSRSDYSYFHVGCVLTDDGSQIPTGAITMNTGHAELWHGADSAKAHYDNTGFVVADVCCGEDDFGIWVAGAIRPDADELTVRRLRGAALSGDWRQIGGSLELVAALAVNVPGFPITRPKSRVASGAPMSLVAAGRMSSRDAERLRDRLSHKNDLAQRNPSGHPAQVDENLKTIAYVLERQARTQLRSEVHSAVKR
jgi:hypothetical protein